MANPVQRTDQPRNASVLVSLVVTTYNRAASLERALISVREAVNCCQWPAETIVVDNNSTDGTPEVVERLNKAGFPSPLIYVLESQQGLSHARNRGLREATGKYIVFVDDDQVIDKQYLERLPEVFNQTDAVCLGGPILFADLENMPPWLVKLSREHGQYCPGGDTKVLGPEDTKLWGGNMAFLREELVSAGGFDVRLGHAGSVSMGGEDFELQTRLHALGKRVVYCPRLVQYHYLGRDRFHKNYWRKRYFGYGRSRCLQTEADWATSRRFMNIPRWLWWRLFSKNLPGYIRALKTLDAVKIFQHELYIWKQVGWMHQARKNRRTSG